MKKTEIKGTFSMDRREQRSHARGMYHKEDTSYGAKHIEIKKAAIEMESGSILSLPQLDRAIVCRLKENNYCKHAKQVTPTIKR